VCDGSDASELLMTAWPAAESALDDHVPSRLDGADPLGLRLARRRLKDAAAH